MTGNAISPLPVNSRINLQGHKGYHSLFARVCVESRVNIDAQLRLATCRKSDKKAGIRINSKQVSRSL